MLSFRSYQLLTNLLLPFGLGCSQETQQTCSLKKGLSGASLVVWEQQQLRQKNTISLSTPSLAYPI